MNVQVEAIKSITAEAVSRYFEGSLNKKKKEGMDRWLRDFYPDLAEEIKLDTDENRVKLFEALFGEAISDGRAKRAGFSAQPLALAVSATTQDRFSPQIKQQVASLGREKAFYEEIRKQTEEAVQWFRKNLPKVTNVL